MWPSQHRLKLSGAARCVIHCGASTQRAHLISGPCRLDCPSMSALLAPAAVTILTVALLLSCAAYVAWARGRYGVHAPPPSGHPQFDIAYRIQMNTQENALAFL